jgi:SDR family mycofactocin-dependent oxidoreductase
MTEPLAGKVALITGGARGLGRSHAVRLAEAGADIAVVDICRQIDTVGYPMSTPADLAETVKLVEATGRRAVADIADVRDRAALNKAVDAAVAELGRIDCVITNAGIMPTYGPRADTPEAWHDCLDVILTGTMNTIEATYPQLIEQGAGGSIVVVGSMAGMKPMMRTEKGRTLGTLAYCAGKAAVANLATNYASFLARHRIRVNSVHPGGVHTPMVHNDITAAYFAESDPEDLLVLVPAIPVDMLDPTDVSELVLWLCSDASRYFTGNSVRLDAGASLR